MAWSGLLLFSVPYITSANGFRAHLVVVKFPLFSSSLQVHDGLRMQIFGPSSHWK